MIEYYKGQLEETRVKTMGWEVCGTVMNATEYHIADNLLTEAVTKCAECATQVEACMAQMEANFEEKFLIMTMQQPPQQK